MAKTNAGSILPTKINGKVVRGTWRVRVDYGPNPRTGKRDRVDKRVKGTRSDAEQVLKEMLSETRDEGVVLKWDRDVTFGQYAKEYVRTELLLNAEKGPDSNTTRGYVSCLDLHILPRWENVALKDLSLMSVKDWADGLKQKKRIKYIHVTTGQIVYWKNRRLSNRRQNQIIGTFKMILTHAISHGVTTPKPWLNLIKRPNADAGKTHDDKAYALTLDEVRNTVEMAQQSSMSQHAVIVMALATGGHRSELQGLRWQDLKLDANPPTVAFTNGLDYNFPIDLNNPERLDKTQPRQFKLSPLKNSYRVRKVAIPAGDAFFFKRFKEISRQRLGDKFSNKGFVFVNLSMPVYHKYRSVNSGQFASIAEEANSMFFNAVSETALSHAEFTSYDIYKNLFSKGLTEKNRNQLNSALALAVDLKLITKSDQTAKVPNFRKDHKANQYEERGKTNLRVYESAVTSDPDLMNELIQQKSIRPNKTFGDPIKPDALSKGIKRIMDKAGCDPRANLKSLRHTHATQLLLQKVPLGLVSERLGHKDVQMTHRVYQHVVDQLDGDIVKALEVINFPGQMHSSGRKGDFMGDFDQFQKVADQ